MPVAKLCGLTLGAEGPIQVPSETPRVRLPGGDAHREATWVRPRGVSLLQKQSQGAPRTPAWGCGLARHTRASAWSWGYLGLKGPVEWLAQNFFRVYNKASAPVPSNHSMLLQVAVGTREFFGLFVCFLSERKKRERKIRIAPVLDCRSPAQPQPLQLLLRFG